MKHLILFGIILNLCAFVFSQDIGLYLYLDEPVSTGDKNVYGLNVHPYMEDRINEISGEKFKIPSCKLTFNGVPLDIKSCKIRGHTTLHFKRKSFSVSFLGPVILGGKKVEKLALNSLAMDQNYYRNRLSFLLMGKLDIFHLQNQFAELLINGNSAGLYLAVQKPEDYIRSLGSTLLVRREYEGRYSIEYSGGEDARGHTKRLRGIPKLARNLEGQQLYDSLNAIVHLEQYFRWLAFNYLIKNGDYTDELFLFLTGEENQFQIIPWDYDDIFQKQPHDGFERRNKVLEHKLLFSGEAYLDVVIDKDNYLYVKFLDVFHQVLEILTPQIIKETFEQVYRELHPYFSDQELIGQSESDHNGPTNLGILKTDLQNQFQAMLIQRLSIETIIAAELNRLSE